MTISLYYDKAVMDSIKDIKNRIYTQSTMNKEQPGNGKKRKIPTDLRKIANILIIMTLTLSISPPSPVNAAYESVSVTAVMWGSQQSPMAVAPGTENNPLTIYFTNFGVLPVQNIKVILDLKQPFSTVENNKGNLVNNINIIPQGETLSTTFYLNIASDCTLGIYTLTLKVDYFEGSVERSFTSDIKLPVTTSAKLSVQNVFWGALSNPISVSAGTNYAPLVLNVKNVGDNIANQAKITVHITSPFISSLETEEVTVDLGVIPVGATVPAQLTTSIESGISTGEYPLNVTLTYNNGVTSKQTVYVPVTTSADLYVQNAFWGALSNPISVSAGTNYAPLVLNVKNVGDNIANHAGITIHLSKPFFSSETEKSLEIGIIPIGATVPIQFTVSVDSGIATGEYPLNITLDYNNGIKLNQIIYVPVLGAPKIVVQNYVVQQGNVFPGDNQEVLNVYLVNSGNSTASDVMVEITLPAEFTSSYPGSNTMTIGQFPIGQPEIVSFTFNVAESTPSPASYMLPLSISYGDQQNLYTIPVLISAKASFTETLDPSPLFQQGASNVKLSFTLTNSGNVTAKSTQIQLLLPNQFTGTTFGFLGDTASGISNIASFSLDTASDSPPGTYYGTVRVTWLQDNAPGKQFTQDITLTLTVNQSIIGVIVNNIYLLLVIVLVLIVAIIYTVYRRRK